MFRLVKMQKDPTDAFDNVVRIDVEIDLVGIQGQTCHATAPPRERTLLCRWKLLLLLHWLLLLLHRLGRHETRGQVGVDGGGNLLVLLRLELLVLLDRWRLCELLLLLLLLLHHWLRLLELLLMLLHWWLLRWTGSEQVRLSTSTTVAPEGIVPKHVVVERRVHHLVNYLQIN